MWQPVVRFMFNISSTNLNAVSGYNDTYEKKAGQGGGGKIIPNCQKPTLNRLIFRTKRFQETDVVVEDTQNTRIPCSTKRKKQPPGCPGYFF